MSNNNADDQNDSGTDSEIIDADDDGEIISDGGVAASDPDADEPDLDGRDIGTPRETKETIAGVSALASARTHWENSLEVMGSGDLERGARVTLSVGNAGNPHDASIVVGMDPATARGLAETLRRRADYAERYVEKKAEESDED